MAAALDEDLAVRVHDVAVAVADAGAAVDARFGGIKDDVVAADWEMPLIREGWPRLQTPLEIFPSPAYNPLMKPFEEIVQFIADAAGAEKLRAFRPSATAEKRVAELLARQEQGVLKPKEREELQMFVQLDHVMSLAKARARVRSKSRIPAAA